VGLLPRRQRLILLLTAVRDDRPGTPVAAVGDHGRVTRGMVGPGLSEGFGVVAVTGSGMPTATTNCVSASMTT
jgi:hypothetical protein